jgi:5-methylcytosine-specific restriction protein A
MAKGLQSVSQAGTNQKRMYNLKRWKDLRKLQLTEQPFCAMCETLGKLVPATVVDHVKPHRGDPELFFHNQFQSLCKMHHDRNKQIEERSGVILGGKLDGVPIDPNHHWNVG